MYCIVFCIEFTLSQISTYNFINVRKIAIWKSQTVAAKLIILIQFPEISFTLKYKIYFIFQPNIQYPIFYTRKPFTNSCSHSSRTHNTYNFILLSLWGKLSFTYIFVTIVWLHIFVTWSEVLPSIFTPLFLHFTQALRKVG